MTGGTDTRVFVQASRVDRGDERAGRAVSRLALKLLAPYAAVLVFWVGGLGVVLAALVLS